MPANAARAHRVNVPYLSEWVGSRAGFARVPGVQFAVLVDDEVVLDGAWGVADVTTGEPLRTDHLFRVASHSKTFTATALARLAERGALRLDDPLSQHVPELGRSAVGRVTVREALGHTGGVLRDGRDADYWQLAGPFPDRDTLLASVLADGEVLGRSEHFKYSNLTYGLLGLVIQAVTGVTYAEHVRTDVIDPLGLADTFPEIDDDLAPRCVTGHSALSPTDDRRLAVAHTGTGALAAATGFCSTAHDLVRWTAAHFDGSDLLTDESRRLLHRDESVIDLPHSRLRRYGLGFESHEIEGRRVVGHSGGFPGQLTRTWADPAGRVAVSVLTNAVDGPADGIATGLFALVATALDAAEPSGPSDELDRWTGRFANLWGLRDVVRLGDRLWLIDPRADDPLAGAEQVSIDGATLRPRKHDGFGPVGEAVEVLRGDGDRPAAIVVGGMTSWRAEEYERERQAQLDRHAAARTE